MFGDCATGRLCSVGVAVLLLSPTGMFASVGVTEPDGYRMENYRAPVPETLRGATVVDAFGLHALLDAARDKTVLIDVMPLHPKPPDFPSDRLWRPPPRYNLPGSTWLPNVGYGTISPQFENYLVTNLRRLIADNRHKRLVFYCAAACWMSWNAAKRALALGFHNIYWFPGGTDEWTAVGYMLTAADAIKMPVETPDLHSK